MSLQGLLDRLLLSNLWQLRHGPFLLCVVLVTTSLVLGRYELRRGRTQSRVLVHSDLHVSSGFFLCCARVEGPLRDLGFLFQRGLFDRLSHNRVEGRRVYLVDVNAILLFLILYRRVTLMSRLCYLMQVQVGDVEVRGSLDSTVTILSQVRQQANLLAVLRVVTTLDALGRLYS